MGDDIKIGEGKKNVEIETKVGGPSGSGKTSLAHKMANIVGCEVVSLESYYKSEQVKDFKYDDFSSLYLSLLSKVNDHLPRAEVSRSAWDYPSTINEEPTTTDSQSKGDAVMGVHAIPEECSPTHHNSNSPQELLDLGEVVGTQSRGLSQDLINLLPTSKYKFKNLFSAKKARERCVVFQMRYKRGDRQIKLMCKHVYHSECITKWLSISKVRKGEGTGLSTRNYGLGYSIGLINAAEFIFEEICSRNFI
ncbi:hypothetical protein SO802_033571 [Lithocarpus litseifolius]|uniref:RING-type domain-containing protein n=1 Tax=Lithocarpus litseifolius TaxID=425828 RepID=A0AAW2BDB4_9ROSI